MPHSNVRTVASFSESIQNIGLDQLDEDDYEYVLLVSMARQNESGHKQLVALFSEKDNPVRRSSGIGRSS